MTRLPIPLLVPLIFALSQLPLASGDRLMQWRNPSEGYLNYDSCNEITLNEGLIVSFSTGNGGGKRGSRGAWNTGESGGAIVDFIDSAQYTQKCYRDAIPMLETNVGLLMSEYVQPLPLMQLSWEEWTKKSEMGSFAYSVVPVVFSISVSAVVTWFLTIFVLTNYTIKASFLLRASTSLSSIYLLVTVILTIVELDKQQRLGYIHGAALLDYINDSKVLNILDLIVVILLQINQAQVIMRIFSRQVDKRLTLLAGLVSTLTSQVIWAVTRFHIFGPTDEAGDILPAFIYLVRIAMGVCYSALITVYIFTKANLIIANRSIWLLTFLTVVLIYSPVAFFIADVSNSWVSELSEVFSCVTYVICVVIPWEWCNKLNLILKIREKEGLLGRRFYEDELYELDRYELFMEQEQAEERQNDNAASPRNGPSSGSGNVTAGGSTSTGTQVGSYSDGEEFPKENVSSRGASDLEGGSKDIEPPILQTPREHKLISLLGKTRSTLLNITDVIIAKGLAIPRSVSVTTPPINVAEGDSIQLENFGTLNSNSRNLVHNSNIAGSSRNRRDVFVYSRKEVVINFSDEEQS